MSVMRFLSFCLLILLTSTSLASPINTQIISDQLQEITRHYLKRFQDSENISAVNLNTDSLFEGSYTVSSGFTDKTNTQLVHPQSLYVIGGITKSFIAALLLQLEATPQLQFSIDDKVGKFFPEYSAWANISIRQLLNMTSGIPDYRDQDNFLQDLANHPDKEWQPEELMSYVIKKPLLFQAGNGWKYSNTNYILAGMIIKKFTGHSVEEELNQRFLSAHNLSHLNLTNTFYIPHQIPPTLLSKMVHGYFFEAHKNFVPLKTDMTSYNLSYAGASGAIVSNVEDISKWFKVLFTPNKLFPEKQQKELISLVSTQTGKPIPRPTKFEPGFGLGIGFEYIGPHFFEMTVNDSSRIFGYRVKYIYMPYDNLMISVATNSSTDEKQDHLKELINNAYVILKRKN